LATAHRRSTCSRASIIDINRGESVGIVGPSGSGKSTLLMVIAGLERLDSGEVHVADQALHTLSEDAVAAVRGRSVGIVFQSFHLIPNMTALENVAVPLELAGKSNAFDRAREELIAVGLGERLTHYPGSACPVANSSGWQSPGRWRPIRR
jgi:putative ABC transport system ATP-binding protein